MLKSEDNANLPIGFIEINSIKAINIFFVHAVEGNFGLCAHANQQMVYIENTFTETLRLLKRAYRNVLKELPLSVSQSRLFPTTSFKTILPHSISPCCLNLIAFLIWSLPAVSFSSLNRKKAPELCKSCRSQGWGFTPHRTLQACLPEIMPVLSSVVLFPYR